MLIELKDIEKSFENSRDIGHARQEVLKGVNLQLKEGETMAVLGPSGSGKSTLLNILGSLEEYDRGSYSFDGEDMSNLKGAALDQFRNKKIGFIFQSHHLLPQLNVWENVLLPTIVDAANDEGKTLYAEELLQRVGLWEHRAKKPGVLSGGECQRVAVVRSLINSPALLLADEPSGALDRASAESLADLLIELNTERKLSLVMVTHSESLAAKMQRVYQIVDGKLVEK